MFSGFMSLRRTPFSLAYRVNVHNHSANVRFWTTGSSDAWHSTSMAKSSMVYWRARAQHQSAGVVNTSGKKSECARRQSNSCWLNSPPRSRTSTSRHVRVPRQRATKAQPFLSWKWTVGGASRSMANIGGRPPNIVAVASSSGLISSSSSTRSILVGSTRIAISLG